MPYTPAYVVLGAGFSGTAVAVQLLQRLRAPSRVYLIDRSFRQGRGLAYGTNSANHLLNVPAGRMGMNPDHESGFFGYLQQQGLAYAASDFVPRSLYGDYLADALSQAQRNAAAGVVLETVEAEAQSVSLLPEGATLRLVDGREIHATAIVMALGNFTPKSPNTPSQPTWDSPRMINDVWTDGKLLALPRTASVLMIGTGLTAYDTISSLLDRGHTGPITMLSRRGLLPQPHRQQTTPPPANPIPPILLEPCALRQTLAGVRRVMREAQDHGHDWRDVLAGLRAETPRLWRQLEQRQRAQFLRHLLPYWDTHRHRVAPPTHQRIQTAMDSGQVGWRAGRLVDAVPLDNHGITVTYRLRTAEELRTARFGALVNCTGPSHDLRTVRDPLIHQLIDAGMLTQDPLRLGLLVDSGYRLRNHAGDSVPQLRYIGPLLKAQRWEATAVPELRMHAKALVNELLGTDRDAAPD